CDSEQIERQEGKRLQNLERERSKTLQYEFDSDKSSLRAGRSGRPSWLSGPLTLVSLIRNRHNYPNDAWTARQSRSMAELMRLAGRKAAPPSVQGVLLSHAHSDHADYISFLHKDIPLYMGATCQTILQALQDRAPRDIEKEVLDFVLRPAKRGNNSRPIKRKIETFRSGGKFKIGSLEVHPIHVDHSIPGAYGFI